MKEKSIKFLYIDDIPTPYRLGVFKHVQKIFSGQFKIFFCAEKESGRSWNLDYGNLDYEILDGIQWTPAFQKNPIAFKLNINIKRKIRSYNPDVVILSGYMHPTVHLAAHYCRKNKIPYGIVCESSFLHSKHEGMKWQIKKLLLKKIVGQMSFALPLGRMAEKYLRALGATTIPMYYFPNTPDITPILKLSQKETKKIYEPDFREKFKVSLNNHIILFVGRLINIKQPLMLLKTFLEIDKELRNNWNIVFVGDGELRKCLEETAADENNIIFTGWLPPMDVYRFMTISDVFVLSSKYETWGAVVNESMAAGTPVIASNAVGSAYDLIQHGKTGFIFDKDNPDELKAMLLEFIENKLDIEKMRSDVQKKSIEANHEFAAGNLKTAVLNSLNNRGI